MIKQTNSPSTTGAYKTFWHFSRTMSHKSAYKWVKDFVTRERSEYAANPLCLRTREALEMYYAKEYQGD